ncbi:BRO family protein [Clostridium sp.]|uniref:BRO family protein n=1 Tax=Clostridium sp. TaxID=1506 RepID=UPI0039928A52
MNNLMNFQNETFGEIRAINKDNEVWFVGKDIAEKLGYVRPDHAIGKYVDDDDKLMYQIDTSGQNRKMLIINESGLYSLVLSSKLPGAKAFKKWITSEVLPQIRKTGGYIPVTEEDDAETLMAKALMVAQKTLAKKDELLKAKDKELNEKNRFIGQISASENSLLVREVAKVASKNGITIGEKRLWNKLREWGLIFKNTTEPKQTGIDKGYFEVVEGSRESSKGVFTYKTTRVTGKGQVYIIERLLKENIEIA